MATNTIKTIIKNAVKSHQAWDASNPILEAGQVVYSVDKGYMYKVGNGTSHWRDLSYNSAYPLGISAWAKASTKPTYTPTEVGVIGTAPTSGQVAVFDGTTGKIKSTGYTIAKSVPSNAVFTDTKYSVATASTAGLVKSGEEVGIKSDGTMLVYNLHTPRKIELTGDIKGSTTFDGSSNVAIQADTRRYMFFRINPTVGKPYFKIGTLTLSSDSTSKDHARQTFMKVLISSVSFKCIAMIIINESKVGSGTVNVSSEWLYKTPDIHNHILRYNINLQSSSSGSEPTKVDIGMDFTNKTSMLGNWYAFNFEIMDCYTRIADTVKTDTLNNCFSYDAADTTTHFATLTAVASPFGDTTTNVTITSNYVNSCYSATKATNDDNGSSIAGTYLNKSTTNTQYVNAMLETYNNYRLIGKTSCPSFYMYPNFKSHNNGDYSWYGGLIFYDNNKLGIKAPGAYQGLTIDSGGGYIYPTKGTGALSLGKADVRWFGAYFKNSPSVESLEKIKTDIKPYKNGLQAIKETDVYTYKLKEEIKRTGWGKDHTGFVIGDKYNLNKGFLDPEESGIDLYNTTGILTQALKELYQEFEDYKEKTNKIIEDLTIKINN